MEGTQLILFVVVGIIAQYAIIYFAVHSSLEKERYYQRSVKRFLIKRMIKEGFTKQEVIEIMDAKDSEFWDSIQD